MANEIKTYTQTVISEGNIEMLVTFDYYWNDQVEEGHGVHDLSGWSVHINYIELVIAGKTVSFNGDGNILKYLDLPQYLTILEQINIDDIEGK
jgi:hypothetical protein